MPKAKTESEELEKVAERLKSKIKEWIKRPGLFYLGESFGYSVIVVRENGRFDYFDPSNPMTISQYASKFRPIAQEWKKIRERPHIALAYNPGNIKKRDKWLVFKKKEKKSIEQIFVSLTIPSHNNVYKVFVQSLISTQDRILIASARTDHFRGGSDGEPVLFAQTGYQKWRARIADLDFFNSILKEPNSA